MQNVSQDDEHARLVAAIPRHTREDGTVNSSTLAGELDIPRTTVQRRLASLSASGALGTKPVLPGFGIKTTSAQYRHGELVAESVKQGPLGEITEAVPKGFAIKGVSTLRDAHGRTIFEWTKTREEPNAVDLAEALKTAFVDYEPCAAVSVAPEGIFDDRLTLYPLSDMHLGMFAWKAETDINWDLKIAEKTIGDSMDKLISMSAPSELAVILGGGDQMHADNNSNETARSGNALQVDGRYQKVVGATCRLFVRITDLALTKHRNVIVRILQGNHDEHASIAIAYFLAAWYRNEPRVTVDLDPSLFWWFRFGQTFLGATHGHEAKPEQMASIMAHRRAEDWGKSKHRFCHTFHVHHASKRMTEGGGVITETHQAPIPQDAWHFGSGFLSGRSLCAIVYDKQTGEVARSRVVISN